MTRNRQDLPLQAQENLEQMDHDAFIAEKELRKGMKDGTISTPDDVFAWVNKWWRAAGYKRLCQTMKKLVAEKQARGEA